MAGDESGNVKVVVRVRRFIPREREAQAHCLVKMDPETQSTTLLSPSTGTTSDTNRSKRHVEDKSFIFDHSFWSHETSDTHYAPQETIYGSFASDFLAHNFDGFHTCIFAYGQTGSGKSYTMMGTQQEPGLIPRYCKDLFRQINDSPEPNTTYNVHVSYFEIYNEHVSDLLIPKSIGRGNDPHYLKIRESPHDGVYVQGLTDATVKCFADIERLMDIGDQNRTTASTKMNQTSSRSHAVFTITLKQIQHSLNNDETIERTARMRLVDLAGSERASKTEAKGQRLLEGGKINKSLTTLGRVIAALADPKRQALTVGGPGSGRNSPRPVSRGKGARGLEVVPYRDSVLTWLLKDSLGGNSKTAMVACISPSASDYDETLSTLRYADQAKRIRTRATANIDAVSAAERAAEIKMMEETIQSLQLSLNMVAEKKSQEMEMLEAYQEQVLKMNRIMAEQRQVSDAKQKALHEELDLMRPENARMKGEIEALRRHVALVTAELKNPIIIPEDLTVREGVTPTARDSVTLQIASEDKENSNPLYSKALPDEYEVENLPRDSGEDLGVTDIQEEAFQMLKELGMFRKRCDDDRERFAKTAEKLPKARKSLGLGRRAMVAVGMK